VYDILAGMRVVEVSMWAFVPAAGAVLAEWGAEVIKVVHPDYGDPMRGAPVGDLPRDQTDVDVAFMWEILNRGKRSIGINLSTPESRPVFEELVKSADVFLTNFLPDAREKLRIDIDDIRAINPNIVYSRGTGQGARGPQAGKGGFDHTSFWARSGIAHAASMVTGEFIGQPGAALGDLMSGFSLASGTVAALLKRERTGEPSVVDVSLFGTAAFVFSPAIVASELYGVPTIPRRSHADQPNPLVASYATKDGRLLYISGQRIDQHWGPFCERTGHPELANDERFADGEARVRNARECIDALDAVFAERDLAEWAEILDEIENPWALVQTANEAHHDVQAEANGYIVPVESQSGSQFTLVHNPVQYDEAPTALTRAPDHGEQTDEILLELGLSWDQIIELKTAGAVL
jgi:crotonobetainyl-CoA:carnitine CoA-transferase CaiB-like acyl-CoA transferase